MVTIFLCLVYRPMNYWDGIRDATQYPPICPQNAIEGTTPANIYSEDCLYLNIFAPRNTNVNPHLIARRCLLVHLEYYFGCSLIQTFQWWSSFMEEHTLQWVRAQVKGKCILDMAICRHYASIPWVQNTHFVDFLTPPPFTEIFSLDPWNVKKHKSHVVS